MAYENHQHKEKEASFSVGEIYLINKEYLRNVKPIFQQKCFDCHSNQTKYPWYYKIPGVKQEIDEDIHEGLKHVDMSRDFPFQGHHSPEDVLRAITITTQENTMPPWDYKIFHWGSGLTEEERKIILNWIRFARP